jgi:hypothetical protein
MSPLIRRVPRSALRSRRAAHGMRGYVLRRVRAERFHQPHHLFRVAEFLEHHPGSDDALLDAGRKVDQVGESDAPASSESTNTAMIRISSPR